MSRSLPRHRRRSNEGFTLLELLLVLTILVIIGGLVGTQLVGVLADTKVDATQIQIKELQKSIDLYRIRIGNMPDSLDSLVEGPSDPGKKAKWRRPLLAEIPKDAWDNDFVFTANGESYEIRSGGEDGRVNTDDDVVIEGV